MSIFKIVNLFFILLLPAFCIRAFFLHKKIWKQNKYQGCLAFICGISQDFFVIFQLLFLFLFLKVLMPYSFSWAFSFFIVLTALAQLDMIFDAFFYKKTSMRMELSFFSFFNDLRCFWDSAKEKTFLWFFPSAIFFLIMLVKTFILYENDLFQMRFSSDFILMGLATGLIGLSSFWFLPKKVAYQVNNVIILQEEGVLKKIHAILTKKKRFELLGENTKKEWMASKEEIFTKLHTDYPLFKETKGFQGTKKLHIDILEDEKPHVILLFMESFRAKNIGALGAKNSLTPNFDRLAKEGILFNQFYANSVKTSRAVTSSLFGIPSDIYAGNLSSRPNFPMVGIADVLQAAGYQTSYLHNGLLQFENQLEFFKNHGFEQVIGRDEILQKYPDASKTSWGVHDEYLMRFVANWLEKEDQKRKPIFSTMFTITNHHPWAMPPDYEKAPTLSKKTAYSRYQQTFRYSDQALGLFIDLLRKKNLSKKTILFILGDHGQPMGEHNHNFSEQKNLYEENIHVPLLILADGRIRDSQIIDTVASQVDLLPTIMDLLGVQGINHSIGSSLLRETKSKITFFHNPYGLKYFGARKDNFKCIYTKESNEIELYNLRDDPQEQINLAATYPDIASEFLGEINQFVHFFSAVYENYRIMPYVNESRCVQGIQSGLSG